LKEAKAKVEAHLASLAQKGDKAKKAAKAGVKKQGLDHLAGELEDVDWDAVHAAALEQWEQLKADHPEYAGQLEEFEEAAKEHVPETVE
jgi:hypothetical protein